MFSRDELIKQAQRRYPTFLRSVVEGVSFFPLEVRIGKSQRADIYAHRLAELEEFRLSAARINLAVDWRSVSDSRFGTHERPERAYFANEDDYLQALGKQDEFEAFRQDVSLILAKIPTLEAWIPENVMAVVDCHAIWPELLNVVQWFGENPRSGLYLRQLPVEGVDTKFFERHRTILHTLLQFLYPEAVDASMQRFEACHGLRWEEPLVRLRFLDDKLRVERGFPIADLAVPAPLFRSLSLSKVTVVITENLRNFLSLPSLPNSVALLGSGDAAALLAGAPWLEKSRILYWGDVDARGFAILARLRSQYCHVESALMDFATLEAHRRWAVVHSQTFQEIGGLTPEESSVLAKLCKQNIRLEQERIPFPVAEKVLKDTIFQAVNKVS
jgi:hypothetical protein